MKLPIFLFFICISVNISSQNNTSTSFFLKKRIPSYIGTFSAGMADGFSENLKWKYHRFQTTFPNANPQYWNPYDSWDNKWKNGDPLQGERFFGSSTFLAWTTDGYHMLNTTSRFLMKASYVISLRQIQNHDWKVLLIDFSIHTILFGLGYNFTDRIILHN